MGRYTNRLLFALIISSSGFASSWFWYNKTSQITLNSSDKKPIATLIAYNKFVKRRPISRSIWESISRDDSLYAGEAIKTLDDSDAKIKFNGSETVIELEPNSLIVLEESKGSVALNFLKGNMFLKSAGKSKSNLTIKAGKNKIDVANASLSLSQTKKGDVDLDVYKGKASLVQKNGKNLEVSKKNSGTLDRNGLSVSKEKLVITYPNAGDNIYYTPSKKEPLRIKWKKLPKGYTVYVATGKRRRRTDERSPVQSWLAQRIESPRLENGWMDTALRYITSSSQGKRIPRSS